MYLAKDRAAYNLLPRSIRADQSFYSYLLEENKGNDDLKRSIALLQKYSPKTIVETYKLAKAHINAPADLQIMTVHSSKGLSFDEVILDDDVNAAIEPIVERYEQCKITKEDFFITEKERIECYIYYVAVSRCRYAIHNAEFLDYVRDDYKLNFITKENK